MGRLLHILLALVLPLAAGAQTGFRCDYWFDNDHTNLSMSTSAVIPVDATGLFGFHLLNVQVTNNGVKEAPQAYLFYRYLPQEVPSTSYTCWLDNDLSTQQTITTPSYLFDVSALRSGFHLINVKASNGLSAEISSYLFYIVISPASGNSNVYTCWFDNDLSTQQSFTSSSFSLDVSALSAGFHLVNVRSGSGGQAELESYLFYKAFTNGPHCDSYTCWIDEDESNSVSGMLGNGNILLDVSGLACGTHTVNIHFCTGDSTRIESYQFTKNSPIVIDTFASVLDTLLWHDSVYRASTVDTLHYTAVGGCDSAIVLHLIVTGWPDNMDSVACTRDAMASQWGIQLKWSSTAAASPLVNPLVGDIDGDGIPEIVCFAPDNSYNFYGTRHVLVFDSRTHEVVHTFTLADRISTVGATPYGIVKLPNGHVIFAVCMYNQGMAAYDLTTHATTPLWTSQAFGDNKLVPTVAFTDFNCDGWPELYIGNRIYDAATGALLVAPPAGGNKGEAYTNALYVSDEKSVISFAYNVTGDIQPELLVGNQVYSVNITNRNGLEDNSMTLLATAPTPPGVPADGHAQVADFNLDGHPDIFVSTKDIPSHPVMFYVWDIYNNTVSSPISIPSSTRGKSVPLIADIDNDGSLEVVIQASISSNSGRIKAYKYNVTGNDFTHMWDFTVDEDSWSNAMTMFDFNLDGMGDILMSDQSTVKILNGSGKSHLTGNDTVAVYPLSTLSFGECTVMQYPVVADVDADGSAEIVVCGRFGSGHTWQGFLNVFHSATTPWAPARKVWNQYMYNVSCVNEDLTVPQYTFNNSQVFFGLDNVVRRPFNNFLQQQTTLDHYGRPFAAAADIVASTATALMDDDTVRITVEYANQGDVDLQAPYGITVYKNGYRGVIIQTDTITQTLIHSGNQVYTHSIAIPQSIICSLANNDSLVIAINDLGDGIAQHGGTHPECDTTNNTVALNLPSCEPDCDIYTIANGTVTNSNVPIKGNSGNNLQRTQTIYPATMLTSLVGKRIDSLHYHVSSGSFSGGDWTISIGITRWERLQFTFDNVSELTEVYHGPLTADAANGMSIRLDSSFAYSGGNILIQFVQNSRSVSSTCFFLGISPGGYTSRMANTYSGNVMTQNGSAFSFTPVVEFHACADSSIDTSHTSRRVALPYCENFDNYPSGEGNMPLYWRGYNTLSIDMGRYPLVTNEYYVSPSRSLGMHIMGNNSCYAILPNFAIDSLQQLNISFMLKNKPTDQGMFIIGVLPDTNNISSFQPLDTIIPPADRWIPVSYSFSNYHGTAKRVAFLDRPISGYTFSNLYIDNFVADTWVHPTVERTGSSQVRIIVPEGDSADYWLEYGLHGFTPGYSASTIVHVTASPYYITGLDDGTDYDFYTYPIIDTSTIVRSTCRNPIPITSCITYTDTTATACDGFIWYGTEYTASATPTKTFNNAAGCDSIVTLNLTIRDSTNSTDIQTACNSYTWIDGNIYTANNSTATHTLTNAAGCDSVVTLNLTVNQPTHGTVTATECDYLTWNGINYTASGDYTYSHTDANGCTQVDTLHLTVNYSSTGTEDTTVCNSFVWHGTEYIASTNTPTFTSTNAAGCDSVTTLHLTIIPCSTTDITTCDTFTWRGTLYSTSGQYYDGTDTLNLTINYSTTGDTIATACDSFAWYGTSHTASATPIHTFTNAAGCDSTVTLNLTIYHTTTGDTAATACDGFIWYGTEYTASANPTKIFTNAAGCDSTVTLNLSVRESTTGTDVQTACDSYTWIDGKTYTASNSIATHTLTNAVGCDSTVTLHLNINYSSTGDTNATVCDSMVWHGLTLAGSGDTTWHSVNIVGCDSTVTLHLTINYSNTGTETVTACNSYVWHGTEYTESTDNATYTSTNAAGCDSVTTLNLTINHCGTTIIIACDTYTWSLNSQTYTSSGTYIEGTDTLMLTINVSTTGTDPQTACDSYTWMDGETYTVSNNTATYTLTNVAGCDSTVTLHLTVNYSTVGDTTATACDSFTWWSTNYTGSTDTATHIFPLGNAVGCDSTVTLHLTVNYSNTGDTTAIACDSFTWWNTNYTSSTDTATHIFPLGNAVGCDSTVTLHLTVNYSNTGDTTATACDSFTWWNSDYTKSTDTATHVYTNAVGCDSTVTLHLIVNYSSTGDTTATACDSFTWWNTDYTTSADTATHVYTNAAGCDSTVTIHLTINHSNTGTETVTACNSYVWHGTEYTESTDTATYTTTNAAGCDSVTTLYLTVNHCGTTIITACDTYTWSLNSQTYTSSGTYIEGTDTLMLTINASTTGTDPQTACDSYTWMDGETYIVSNNTATYTLTNVAGCDSTVTLHLTVNYSTVGDTTAVACDSFTWWNTNYTSCTDTATHIFPLGNAVGCDSTVTLHLTINYSSTGDTTATVCDSFTWWNTNYTSSTDTATHIFPLGNASGCDSTVTLHLTVNYSNTSDTTATACDSFTWWNTDYTNSTDTATHVYTNAVGCDSTVTLHLIVNYSSTGDTTATACDSFTWYDTVYTVSSTPTHTYINAAGCDSVVTLNLTVNYSTTGDTTATACDSFTWYGAEYTASGTPTHTFPLGNAVVCDSTVTLHLTINYSSTGDTTAIACDSFIWWNTNYTNSTDTATHIFTLGNAVGCDSTVTLNLTVNYSNTGTDTQTACDSHTWIDGETYIVSNNTATYTLTNVAGCDSTVTLKLTVNYSSTCDTTVTACNSYVWHGTEYTESSDTATYTTNNAVGCDSVTTLHLQVWPTYDIHTYDTICDDSSRFFIDSNYFQTGIYLYTYLSVHACDSLQTLNLTVYPTYDLHIFDTIYDGDTYTFEQTLFDTTGSYPFLLQAVGGCDSLRTLHLQRNRRTYNDSTLCQNQMPLLWNGVNFSDRPHQGNVLTLTDSVHLSGLGGIDSLVVMTVTMYDTSATTEHIHACDSIRWQDGVNYTASTDTPYVILTNVAQCDSVVHLKLAVDYTRWFTDTHTVCDSLLWIDQQWYYADNSTAVDTIRTVADCDSIVTLSLTVHYSANTALRDTICHGQSYTWHGFVVRSASSHLTEDFTFTDTLSTIHGCDSVVGMIVTKMAQPQITLDYITNCRDSSYTVTATATAPITPGGAPQPLPYTLWSSDPVDLSIDGQEHQSVITVTPQTTTEYILYADYRSTPFCPSSASIALNPVSVPHAQLKVTPEKLSYQVNDFTAYDLDPNSRYLRTWYVDWQPLPTDAHVIHHSADITRDSVILALAIDNGQCIDTAVKVIPINKISVTAPNIFTPGSNDANGLFIIVTQGVIDADLLIYNRDGLLVHRSSDIGQGWDGHNLSGSPCPQGNYVWKLEYTPMAQPTIRKVQVGSVLLIR